MDDERIDLVFGRPVDQDQHDLTDAEARSELLGETFDTGDDLLAHASHEAIAYQLLFDDPPEAWATATRLSGLGLTREAVLAQVADAFTPHLLAALEQDEPYNRAAYAAALDSLPQPLSADIGSALLEVVRAEPGITAEQAVAGTVASLPHGAPSDVLTSSVEKAFDDLVGPLGPMAAAGERIVEVASFLAGKVFTHRLTGAEVESGVVHADFDLWVHRRREDLHDDTNAIELESQDGGPLGWHLSGAWRQSASEGSVLAVRVAADGGVAAALLDEPPEPDPEIVAALWAVYDRDVGEFDLPVSSEELVTAMILERGAWFDEPTAPLSEIAEAAGLEVRGIEAAHDEHVWRNAATFSREMRVFRRMRSNHQAASKVLSVLELAETIERGDDRNTDGDGATDGHPAPIEWRTAFRLLDDLERLSVVTEELFHPPDNGLPQIDPRPFVEAALTSATNDRDHAIALWLECFVAEGRGDLDAAEAALEAALVANRDYLPAIDRLAWYASDRGDAPKAAHLWRSLADNQAVAEDLRFVTEATEHGRDIGRNDPCWCGSGRKFKQCHLEQPDVASLADRVPWLAHKASAFVERRGGQERSDVVDVALARATDPDQDASVALAYSDPLVMDLVLTEGGWFEQFLAERGSLLPEDEAQLGASWLGVPRTVYEVEAVGDDDTVMMRDVRTDERLEVTDPVLSQLAQPAALICGRAVPNGSGHQFIGGPFEVAPGQESDLLSLLDEAHDKGDALSIAEWVAASERSRQMQET